MKNILIVNQPTYNRGDESAHKSLVRNLNSKFPKTKITVLFVNTPSDSVDEMKVESIQNRYVNIDSKIRGTRSVQKWSLRLGIIKLSFLLPLNYAIAKLIQKTDLVICAPGGICMGAFQDWSHIYILSLAQLYKKKVAYYSRSFGPFPVATKWNRIFKDKSYGLLNYFDFLSIRDSKTMQLADEIGLSYIPSIDTALLDTPKVEIPKELKKLITDKEYIVLVPNSLTWHPAFKNCEIDYLDKFYLRLIKMLLSKYKNVNIIMLPQLFNVGDKGDEGYFKKFKRILSDERIIVVPEIYSSDIQQRIISKAKLMIGARYHSVVFAINNEVPFVALSYEHKILGLLDILNLKGYMYDIEQMVINQQALETAIDKIEKIIAISKSESEAKVKARKIAQSCMDNFLKRYSPSVK